MTKATIRERKGKKPGLYVEVTDGKKKHFYKYDPNVPLDAYIRASKKGRKEIIAWKSEKPAAVAQREAYVKRLRQKGRLADGIAPGVTTLSVNLSDLGNAAIRQKTYERMFSPLVRDKQLLNIVVANKNKLVSRFAYAIEYHGKGNHGRKMLGTIKDVGNRTLEEIYETYHSRLKHRRGLQIGSTQLKDDAYLIRIPKNAVEQYDGGLLERVVVNITFRKG